MTKHSKLIVSACALVALSRPEAAHALISFNVDAGTFGTDTGRYNAAVASMQAVVNRYNAYGDFGNNNIYVYYNAGIPTAQSDYQGSIGLGGTYPNERVAQHETNHYFGSGTYGNWYNLFSNGLWTGPRVGQLIQQFNGEGEALHQSGVHFYDYGLNYDSEVTTATTYMRNIAIMYAMRADMGNGNTANPWSATSVTLTGSDRAGSSAFNWFGGGFSGDYAGWNDKYFAHAGAAYSTGAYDIRTPEGFASWKFYGDSLTVNSGGRLLYNGYGTDGKVTINNLTVAGGTIRHDQFSQDLFQLTGNNITFASTSTVDAANGNIKILAPIGGAGGLIKNGTYALTLAAKNTYAGNTVVNAGTLDLATGGTTGSVRGTIDLKTGSTLRLSAADALGTGAGTSVTQVNAVNATVDNASSGANGYNTNWTLTGSTLSSSGGGSYHVNAGGGNSVTVLPSVNSSVISGDLVIRGANATLPLNVPDGSAASDLVISGAVRNSTVESGANGISKSGAGTLVLSGANTYTGDTNVSGGVIAYTTSQSNIGAVSLADSTGLRIGSAGASKTTLNATSLTLGSGGATTLGFDFAAADSTVALVSTGLFTANGAVNVSLQNAGALSSGEHTLIGYNAFAGNATFSLASAAIGPRSAGTLFNNGVNGLVLSVVADRPVWTGIGGGTWAAGLNTTLKNWRLQTAATPTDYLQGDNVLFDDTATGPTSITITGANVTPVAVTFNNSAKAYVINNGFGIAGSTPLVKNGSNNLTINTANTYSGGTVVNAGRLIAGNANALGTGGLTLNSAAFASTTNATVNGPLTVTGASTLGYASQNGNMTFNGGLAGDGTLANFVGSNNNYNVFFNGNGSAFSGSLVYTGDTGTATGWWRFGTDNATVALPNAALVINKGNITDLNAVGKNVGFTDGVKNVTLNIGALSGDGVFQAAFNSPGPNTLVIGALNTSSTFSGAIAGGNAGTNINVTKVGTGTLTLAGRNYYSGTTTLNDGAIAVTANNSLGQDGTAVNFNGGTLVATAGFTNTHPLNVGDRGGRLSINVPAGGKIVLPNGNQIAGTGPLTIDSGTGTGGAVDVNQPNAFAGDLTVSNAVLNVNNGANTVSAGGRSTGGLGNEQIAGRTVSVGNGGTIAFNTGNVLGGGGSGVNDAPAIGLVVNAGGTLKIAAADVGGPGGGDANILGGITLNGGTLAVGNGYNANYQAAILLKNVTVGGSAASVITSTATNTAASGIMLGDQANGTDAITFNVADATGDAAADLVVSARLTNSANYAGNSAAVGALVKSGVGTISLKAANNYTGGTTVQAGTLQATYAGGSSAASPLLGGAGTDIQSGRVVFDYTGASSPIGVIKAYLITGYRATTTPGVMDTGILRSSTATAARGLGYADDGQGYVTVMATLFGDADLNGNVDFNDFLALQNGFNTNGPWASGDFNYDGTVNFNDFLVLQNNFGKSINGSAVSFTREQVAAMTAWAADPTAVPEPAGLAVLSSAVAAAAMRRRRRAS